MCRRDWQLFANPTILMPYLDGMTAEQAAELEEDLKRLRALYPDVLEDEEKPR